MENRDIVVMGASAGGVEALTSVTRSLPEDLPAAVFVVLHLPPHSTSVLPRILSRSGGLPAGHAQDGDAIEPGRIYVAPPGRHLLVKPGRVALPLGPRENGARPAIDPLFRTAARSYGPRVVGVILSGTGDDGAAGMGEIKRRGGVAVVADPDDVAFGDMARYAMENVAVDHVVPLSEIGGLIVRLVREPGKVVTPSMETEQIDSTETDASL